MKGLLIFVGLIVAACLYVLGNFGKIADPILANIAVQEGSVDSVQNASQQDGFTAKYQTYLDQRYWLGRVALIMDSDTFLKVSGDTWDRYNNTPLQNDPEFGFLIFNRADLLVDRNDFTDAGALYEQYMQLFPQGENFLVARSAMSSLRINHGVQ